MPILYANAAIAADTNLPTSVYLTIPFTVTTTQSMTLVPYQPVWIKGTVYDNMGRTMFGLGGSTTPLTQTVPDEYDGYQYIELGIAYSSTGVYLLPYHPIYAFERGYWGPWVPGNPVGVWSGQISNLSISVAGNTAATIFNHQDSSGDMSNYIPNGAKLIAATFNWATSNAFVTTNCQVINNKLYLRVYNLSNSTVVLDNVALQLFYK